jgi:GT2 family glycosyltransferase
MTLYAIILNYKTKDETLACIASLKACTIPYDTKLQLIVVDNASGDGIERAVSAQHHDVEFIQTGANIGYTGGNNAGIREVLKKYTDTPEAAKHDHILILNNDTIADKNFIVELVNGTKRHAKAGIISPKIYFTKNSWPQKILDKNKALIARDRVEPHAEIIWFAGAHLDWDNILGSTRGVDEIDQGQYNQESQIEVTTGCCVLIPVEVMQKLHGFDDKYFMYYEDIDLSVRVKKLGYEIWYIPKAIIWHENAHSSGVGSPLQDYYITRNRLLFGFKYARLRTKLALVKEALSFYKDKNRVARWHGVKDFFTLKFGKGTFLV